MSRTGAVYLCPVYDSDVRLADPHCEYLDGV
jgi:hypothetical protein